MEKNGDDGLKMENQGDNIGYCLFDTSSRGESGSKKGRRFGGCLFM